MDLLTPERILTLVGFLGVLILIWAALRLAPARARLGRTLAGGLTATRRLSIAEVLPLGAGGRAILMQADGQSVLVVTGPKGAAAMLPLDPARDTDTEAAQ